MPMPRLPDDKLKERIAAVKQYGSIKGAARALKMPVATLATQIDNARIRFPEALPEASKHAGWAHEGWVTPRQREIDITDGTMLIGSDAHIWPGEPSLAWQAFVAVAHAIKPTWIVANGDMIDGARISRHPRTRGQHTPTLGEEISAVKTAFDMLPKAERHWLQGNHDERVDKYLASNAPELDDFAGTLWDRFPEWPVSWALVVNNSVEIRHRFRGGIHAAYNNALVSGRTCVTGHTHQLISRPVDDRNGRRWGVELGTLADPLHPCFEYAEGAPSRVCPGFAVLTFREGELLPPELCELGNGRMWFRNEPVAGEKPRVRVKAGRG